MAAFLLVGIKQIVLCRKNTKKTGMKRIYGNCFQFLSFTRHLTEKKRQVFVSPKKHKPINNWGISGEKQSKQKRQLFDYQ
ncbi:MAG: hypothetical protein IKX36_05475 [Prevotella sp.]|nr:hypothetical protein [Prevotella sp.]